MVNEISGLGEGLDVGGQPREDVNKVTEEAVRRAQDQAKQAKQIQKEIKDDKNNNNKIALFLSFLFKTIKDEKIIHFLYTTFFTTKDPKSNVTYIRKKINNTVIAGLFYPFYPQETQTYHLHIFFGDLYDYTKHTKITLNIYLSYIKKLSEKFHDNIALDQQHLLELIYHIVTYHNLLDKEALSHEEQIEQKKELAKKLYSN